MSQCLYMIIYNFKELKIIRDRVFQHFEKKHLWYPELRIMDMRMNFAFPRKSAQSRYIFLWADFFGFSFFAFSMQILNYGWIKIHVKISQNGEKMSKNEYSTLLMFIFWLNPLKKSGTRVPASYRDLLGTLGHREDQKWPKICPKLT